ncbi:hypothetical protein [Bordetella genomosp. 1]|uniref:HTH cro/C1-type domain-containing protein n=1 Tax=Bordetella genomosp. 1 TaxID=1395607 RepID=A0ABX4EW83_9BORD|nr:hypothetical protein [Bordetella genomosp. 1]OZI58724.1 hypothetical protein CAL27_18760 [Bordetella genomosp. 1]
MAKAQDIQQVRQQNLQTVVAEVGGPSVLAKRMGYQGPSFISQMANGHRKITEDTARAVEKAAGREPLWLDAPHELRAPAQGPATDPSLVSGAVTVVVKLQQDLGVTVDPTKYPLLVEMVYQQALVDGAVNVDYARKLVQLAS